MVAKPSSRLQQAESLLFVLEDARGRIRALRQVPSVLNEAAITTKRMDEARSIGNLDSASKEPPIRTRVATSVSYEEQQTQALDALDPTEIDTLDPDRIEPPIRDLSEPTPERNSSTDESERAEARARSAAQIRAATQRATENEQKATSDAKQQDDSAYRQAREQGVAAIQLTTEGSARMVRDLVAVGEAMEDDLACEPERSTASDREGGLQIDVLVPEVEVEVDEHLPELTDSALPAFDREPVRIKEGGDPSLIAQFLATAQKAERRGNLTEAITAYGDALDVNGELDIAWLGRGRCAIEQGDYVAALSDLRHARSLNPRSTKPILQMGHLYFARKDYQQALGYYDEVVGKESQNAMALAKRGLCHHYLEQRNAAVSDLELAVAIEPEDTKLRDCLEMVRREAGPQGREL